MSSATKYSSTEQVELLNNEAVLSVTCDEPDGKIERFVYPLPLTINNIRMFWERSKEYKILFWTPVNNEAEFAELLLYSDGHDVVKPRGLLWVVDNFVGVFYMSNIVPGIEADVHYSFFDGRQRGRVPLVKEMLKYGFSKYGFQRFNAYIPAYAMKVTSFAAGVGFKEEGRKRNAVEFRDGWADVLLYGILRDEVLNGS